MEVPDTSHVIEFDGASLRNPGPAGCGALIRTLAAAGGHVIWAGSMSLGHGTNNFAGYGGGNRRLGASAQLPGLVVLHCRGDSALVVRQAEGSWQLYEPTLRLLLAGLRGHMESLSVPVTWEARPREENWCADALAGAAMRGSRGDTRELEWWRDEAAQHVATIPVPAYADTTTAINAPHCRAPLVRNAS